MRRPFVSCAAAATVHVVIIWWWFLLGLTNNMPYLIMLASAKYMSEGGTATVYICTTVPGLLVKLSSSYWFDRVGYRPRLAMATLCMAVAFVTTSYFCRELPSSPHHQDEDAPADDGVLAEAEEEEDSSTSSTSRSTRMLLVGQLCGVAVVSVQIGLGEASLLALAGKLDNDAAAAAAATFTTIASNLSGDGVMRIDDNEPAYKKQSNHTNIRLLAFASGTGLAGFLGYLWKVALTEWFGWSVSRMLLAGLLIAVCYWTVFCQAINNSSVSLLGEEAQQHQLVPHSDNDAEMTMATATTNLNHGDNLNHGEHEMVPWGRFGKKDSDIIDTVTNDGDGSESETTRLARRDAHEIATQGSNDSLDTRNDETFHNQQTHSSEPFFTDEATATTTVRSIPEMSVPERFYLVLSLWPYAVPLFVVYAAEYACQAGAWTAIGFPTVDSVTARAQFYTQSNWLYQAASFVARSSGVCCTVPLWGLWLLPVLQLGNLVFFAVTAATHGVFYQEGLLLAASLYTGFLGGAVYVQGYKRIVADMPAAHTEFALSTTCVAEALGVLVADVAGLFLQSCLYQWNGVPGALVDCPVR